VQVVDRYHYGRGRADDRPERRRSRRCSIRGLRVRPGSPTVPGEASGWYLASVRHYAPGAGAGSSSRTPASREGGGCAATPYAGDDPLGRDGPQRAVCVAGVFGDGPQAERGWVTTTVGAGLTVVGAAIDVASLVPRSGAVPLTMGWEGWWAPARSDAGADAAGDRAGHDPLRQPTRCKAWP
jgi:hypothetical protein